MNIEFLNTHVARGVLLVTDTHKLRTREQVAATLRPWWSKVGEDFWALPGGKIEPQDFLPLIAEGLLTQKEYDDPNFEPSEKLMQRAAIETLKREFLEELGPEAAALIAVGLIFIGRYENYDEISNTTWVSLVFGTHADHKPELRLKPNSNATLWTDADKIINETVVFEALPGHLKMAENAIAKIREQRDPK